MNAIETLALTFAERYSKYTENAIVEAFYKAVADGKSFDDVKTQENVIAFSAENGFNLDGDIYYQIEDSKFYDNYYRRSCDKCAFILCLVLSQYQRGITDESDLVDMISHATFIVENAAITSSSAYC